MAGSEVDATTSTQSCNRHERHLLDGIRQFYKEGLLCDVTLVADDSDFPCNKIVLAACSPYFRAMFTSELKEKGDNTVPIHGVAPEAMAAILDFMYSGDLEISNQNVQNLFAASNFFEMLDLVDLCVAHMIDAINTTNCLEVYSFADFTLCEKLRTAAFSFMLKKFMDISKTEEFLTKADLELLERFIESDGLYVSKEEDVFECILEWIKFDVENRKPAFCKLFKHLRLTLVDDSYLEESIKSHELVKQNPFCSSLIASAKIYRVQSRINSINPDDEDFSDSFGLINPKPRLGMYNRKLIVFSGGASSADDRSLTAFDPITRRNYLGVTPHGSFDFKFKLEHYCLVCTEENNLYFLGGIFYDNYHFQDTGDALQDVYRYDQRDSKWIKVKQMMVKRCAFSACAYGEEIIVSGGKSSYPRGEALDSVEVYDSEFNFWSFIEPLPFSLYYHATCIYQHAMFVFGGKDMLDECVESVCRYDLTSRVWSVVRTQMMKPRAEHLALTVLDRIFIVGGRSQAGHALEVEIYDPKTNRWKYGPDFPEERKILNAVVFDGNILVCGGVKELHRQHKPTRRVESKDLFEYNIANKTWRKRVRMVQYANLQACAIATMNTTFLHESDFVSVGEDLEGNGNVVK